MSTLYTVGYSGWDPAMFVARMQDLSATVVDVRLKPYSQSPHYRKLMLEASLPSYIWLGNYFGNLNYKARNAPVHLLNPSQGIAAFRVLRMAYDTPLVLLCGCPSPRTCHRLAVATLLQGVADLKITGITHLFPHDPDQVVAQ